MASPQRQARIYALREHFKSHILMLKEELNLFFDNPCGVAGHPNYFQVHRGQGLRTGRTRRGYRSLGQAL